MQRISFNSAMLAAVRTGVKTVTRRRFFPELPMQHQPAQYRFMGFTAQGGLFEDLHARPPVPLVEVACPLGRVGDIVRVQEDPTLQLQILHVRAERVRQITDADALAEGIVERETEGTRQWGGVEPNSAEPGNFHWYSSPIDAFRGLLNSIYPTAWSRNEWVWVVEFHLLPPVY